VYDKINKSTTLNQFANKNKKRNIKMDKLPTLNEFLELKEQIKKGDTSSLLLNESYIILDHLSSVLTDEEINRLDESDSTRSLNPVKYIKIQNNGKLLIQSMITKALAEVTLQEKLEALKKQYSNHKDAKKKEEMKIESDKLKNLQKIKNTALTEKIKAIEDRMDELATADNLKNIVSRLKAKARVEANTRLLKIADEKETEEIKARIAKDNQEIKDKEAEEKKVKAEKRKAEKEKKSKNKEDKKPEPDSPEKKQEKIKSLEEDLKQIEDNIKLLNGNIKINDQNIETGDKTVVAKAKENKANNLQKLKEEEANKKQTEEELKKIIDKK